MRVRAIQVGLGPVQRAPSAPTQLALPLAAVPKQTSAFAAASAFRGFLAFSSRPRFGWYVAIAVGVGDATRAKQKHALISYRASLAGIVSFGGVVGV